MTTARAVTDGPSPVVSLAGVPPAALLASRSVAAGDHDTTWSPEAQRALAHAQTSTRLPSPRDFTLRDARCHLVRPGSRLIGSLLLLSDASSLAHRPEPVLRI